MSICCMKKCTSFSWWVLFKINKDNISISTLPSFKSCTPDYCVSLPTLSQFPQPGYSRASIVITCVEEFIFFLSLNSPSGLCSLWFVLCVRFSVINHSVRPGRLVGWVEAVPRIASEPICLHCVHQWWVFVMVCFGCVFTRRWESSYTSDVKNSWSVCPRERIIHNPHSMYVSLWR